MSGHLLGLFERASCHHVRGNCGGPKGVIRKPITKSCCTRPAFNHRPRILSVEPVFSQVATAVKCSKQWSASLAVKATSFQVFEDCLFCVVIEGHFVLSSTFFFEANPPPSPVLIDIVHIDCHGVYSDNYFSRLATIKSAG